jgi:hypothetical protein
MYSQYFCFSFFFFLTFVRKIKLTPNLTRRDTTFYCQSVLKAHDGIRKRTGKIISRVNQFASRICNISDLCEQKRRKIFQRMNFQ